MVVNTLYNLVSKIVPPKDFSFVMNHEKEPPIYLQPKEDLIQGIPDGLLALFAPIVAYWVYSTFFHLIDVYELAEKYRIHPSEEEESRNKVRMHEVLRDVVLQHVIQTVTGLFVYSFDNVPMTGYEMNSMWQLKHKYMPDYISDLALWYGYMYGWSLLKIIIGFGIIDTWQYWLHRTMHMNKWLYRRFHSRHHRLYVPYAFGALYNDPVEGFLLDTAGAGIAMFAMNLSYRESLIMYTFATLKTVDDHCGYRLPYDIFQVTFSNNSIYHDIHHQTWGIKNNFSQPFFTFWDRLSSTNYKFVHEYRAHQDRITLERYKDFLKKKQRRNYTNKNLDEKKSI